METPNFNDIIGKTANDEECKRNDRLCYCAVFIVLCPLIGYGLRCALYHEYSKETFYDTLSVCNSLGLICWALCHFLTDGDKKKKAQIDRFLKIFKNDIAAKYNPANIEKASMMGEFVLGYMSEEEKEKIRKLCAETDFSDYASAKDFIEQIKRIVEPIFAKNTELDKLLKDIATGQTYMFNGWNYKQPGHGGR